MEHAEYDEDFNQKIRYLLDEPIRNQNGSPPVSVDDVYRKVLAEPYNAVRYVEKIIQDHLPGNEDAFLCLIAFLCDQTNYKVACALSFYAFSLFKNCLDICAVGLEASTKLSDVNTFGVYFVRKAESVDYSSWPKSLFKSVCNYYYHVVKADPLLDWDKAFSPGIKSAVEMQKYFPLDEEGYFQEVRLLYLKNQPKEAELRLKSCIYDLPVPEQDMGILRNCPRCARLYLDRVLMRKYYSGVWNEIEEVAYRGIQGTGLLADEEQLDYRVYFMGKINFAVQMKNLEKKKAGEKAAHRDLGREVARSNYEGRVPVENRNQEMKGVGDRCIEHEWRSEEICEKKQSLSEQEIKIVENNLLEEEV